MNSLEGYNTNGYEYRKSQIDRSNSNRLKWMMKEAKKIVEKKDIDANTNNNSAILADKSITPTLHGNNNTNTKDSRNNMFNPSTVNKFNNFKNNLNS